MNVNMASNAMNNGLLSFTLLTFILSLILGISMKFVWSLFATLQLVLNLPLIGMPIPS